MYTTPTECLSRLGLVKCLQLATFLCLVRLGYFSGRWSVKPEIGRYPARGTRVSLPLNLGEVILNRLLIRSGAMPVFSFRAASLCVDLLLATT